MDPDTETASLTIRLPKALRESLLAAAKAQDLTASQLVRKHFSMLFAKSRRKASRKGAAAV